MKFNESVEVEEKKTENEKTQEKNDENIIKINNVEDINKKEEQGELQEKSIEEQNDNKIENEENKNENINNSKEKDQNNSKVKLLQYRQYTEEEMKKLNKNDSEDEFISVDYEKI